MTILWAEQALTGDGWQDAVRVDIGADGRIDRVQANSPAAGHRVGVLLPAPANSHSHAFQRAMAGLTETRGDQPSDSFWTWRKLMYRFLDQITPDQVQAIAALVQIEMLEAGFAVNTEFHYLHHQTDGQPYDDLAEMAVRIAAAAAQTGIGLTLLPVQYQFAGCDGAPLGPGQRRFGNDPDRFARLLDGARRAVAGLPADAALGVAPHSLRAVAPEDLARAADLLPAGPVHIHIAEQLAEVAEVQAAHKARPVEWALDTLPIDNRWCMIHATHMTPDETRRLAATGAVAGLCPITESNLGDGIFNGTEWLEAGGKISIGSDSNLLISLAEEIRVLDHSQRLRDHSRAALATTDRSAGRRIFEDICRGGAQAAGRESGRIEAGLWADLLALDTGHIDLAGLRGDTIIDAFAFTGGQSMVRDVWAAGRHVVKHGRHVRRDTIVNAYQRAVRPLRDGL